MTTNYNLAWDEEEEATIPGVDPGGAARVLVAEDDDSLRFIVASRLLDDGYEVVEADSGPDLLTKLHSLSLDEFPSDGIDLLVLDHRMPGMTGMDVVKKLRAERCNVPIIIMTAFPDLAMQAEARRLGVPLLPKPFSLERLSDVAVSTLLAGRHAQARAVSP